MSIRQMSIGQMSIEQISVRRMSVGEIPFNQMTGSHLETRKEVIIVDGQKMTRNPGSRMYINV